MSHRWLFLCTRPYQYLVARAIRESQPDVQADLVVLKHFPDSTRLVNRIRLYGGWRHVSVFDDSALNDLHHSLGTFRRIFFYNRWHAIVRQLPFKLENYDELFVAHDGVITEYALARAFYANNKRVTLYEEGYGNYINNNRQRGFVRRNLKEVGHYLGFPGSYMGRGGYIDRIYLTNPSAVARDFTNPVAHKVEGLPIPFKDFIGSDSFIKEAKFLYPDLNDTQAVLTRSKRVALILTENWFGNIPNQERLMTRLVRRVQEAGENYIILKRHPGDTTIGDTLNCLGIESISKSIPVELLAPCLCDNGPRTLKIVTSGSAAAINLYMLLQGLVEMDITLLPPDEEPEHQLVYTKFKNLCINLHIDFSELPCSIIYD